MFNTPVVGPPLLSLGESDTLFGLSISRTEIIMVALIFTLVFFYVTIKVYDIVKRKHWSERENRLKAVKYVLVRSQKPIEELESTDLIHNNLNTLYEYYGRSMDRCIQDLGDEFKEPEPAPK